MLKLDINLLFTVINLVVWYLLIKKFLFKPVNNIISKREEAIADRYREAEQEKVLAFLAGLDVKAMATEVMQQLFQFLEMKYDFSLTRSEGAL